jgi:Fic family protein
MPIKRTLLDTVQPASEEKQVDVLALLNAKRRQLRADLVDAAAADEAFRRELLDLLKTLGEGKRGQLQSTSRLSYVRALHEASFTKKEIVELIERLYGVSERQIERDLKSLTAKKP